ncbi:MAG: aromatic ring-hydroxylating dioxygenase subunit alpha [Archangiaceae bacterium]|nr:aromatic ring-hydroxylating dioxygenase subunit alpha [Archangiaceae bacterium]
MSALPPKSSVVKLPDAWFIACASSTLKKKPLAFTLQGTPLVLFRDASGKPAALLDRCPHRNAPLSMGRVTPGGELQCAYHGWRFDGAGACRAVPGLVTDADVSLKARAAEAYPAEEQDGYVWVYSTAGDKPPEGPYRFPLLDDAKYTTVKREFSVNGTLHATVENTLDVPHTAFLHGGLFRTPEKKNEVEVVVRRHGTFAEAEYLGEPRPTGLAGRLLAPQGGVVTHFDRFLLPSIAQVEYRLGEKSHLITTSAMTPIDDFHTRVWAVVTYRLPLPNFLVRPFLTPVAERIFRQDAVMLKAQTEVIRHFGAERYTSTELDVLGHEVWRLLDQHANHRPPPADVKEHRVKMRT